MVVLPLRLGFLVALIGVSSCAASAGAPSAPAVPSTIEVSGTPEGPTINWDKPLASGLEVSVEQARLVGQLSFEPVVPDFTVEETSVVVSDPTLEAVELRAVAFVYDFPSGPDFPEDGRVHVLEGTTNAPQDLFSQIVAGHVGLADEENYDLVTIGGEDALFIHTDMIGRVRFARNGVFFDVIGPALPPDTALALAEDLAHTVDSR